MIAETIVVLLALSLIPYVLAKRNAHVAAYASALLVAPLVPIGLYPLLTGQVYEEQYSFLGWRDLFSVALTPLNGIFVFTIGLVGALVAVFSGPYMEYRAREVSRDASLFYLTYVPFVVSLAAVTMAEHLVMIYVFLEIALITSLLQVMYYGYGDRFRIGLMYLVWSHVAALLMLAGFVLLISPDMGIAPIYGGTYDVGLLPLVLILLGSLIKMAALGLHMWLPYVHAEAPTPLSALLSPVLVGVGGYILIAVFVPLAMQGGFDFSGPLTLYALATGIYGALMALVQTDIKRLLAYSTVSQMGYMLLGIAVFNNYGITGAAIHYLSHGLGKAVLFMAAGYLILYMHIRDITRLGGLYADHAPMAIASIIGFLNLVGILTVGMIAEITLIVGVTERFGLSLANAPYVAALALLLVASAAYSFNTVRILFFGPRRYQSNTMPSSSVLLPMLVAAAVSVVMLLPPFSGIVWENIYRYIGLVLR